MGGNDVLKAGYKDDFIFGGHDSLFGGAGDDVLIGGYYLAGGPGNDRLVYGETQFGGAGNDVLVRGGSMFGGVGNDTYYVTVSPDFFDILVLGIEPWQNVLEGNGQGIDTVKAPVSIDLALFGRYASLIPDPDTDLYPYRSSSVERLVLTGTDDTYGLGNALDNLLVGNSGSNYLEGRDGNDTIRGGLGNDTLNGAAGNDVLLGGPGADTFRFGVMGGDGNDTLDVNDIGIDTIVDFTPGEDAIQLSKDIFGFLPGLPSAEGITLDPSGFIANPTGTAQSWDHHILYNTNTGELYYDADATGPGAALKFATLIGAPVIHADDFFVDT